MVYSGLFNSKKDDRLYDAKDLSHIFDGIINDGVYGTVYSQFKVTAHNSNGVNVATGRAWFNHTYIYNDSNFHLTFPSNIADTWIVIEINKTDRTNRIRWINSLPTNSETYAVYPLARITGIINGRVPNNSYITNYVGTSQCPLVTGPLQIMTTDQITQQWGAEWADFKNVKNADWNKFKTDKDKEIDAYFQSEITRGIEEKWRLFRDAKDVDWNQFKTSRNNEWYSWLNTNTALYKQQWDTWYRLNTEGKSERWEAWYAQFKIDSKDQWDTWFHDTTVGQIEKWWDWWEEYHKVMTSNMIKQWWEWWHPFKDEKEAQWDDWYTKTTENAETNWNTWYDATTTLADDTWNIWWSEHPTVWERQWDDWYTEVTQDMIDKRANLEAEYQKWYDDIRDTWTQFQDAADRWFEGFKKEHDAQRTMPYKNNITDESENEITDANGKPIMSFNQVVIL